MCLAIPGKILQITGTDFEKMGKVSFGRIVKDVNLAYVTEARIDDYVIVHVGFALSILDEEEANKVFEYLREMGELGELNDGEQPG